MAGTFPSSRSAALFLAVLVHAGTCLAGHPLGTEDAGTQGKGNVEVELNWERSSSGGGARDTTIGNTYTMGIARNLDLAGSFTYVFRREGDGAERIRGMGDTEATIKASFLDGGGWVPALGIKAGVLLPTGDGAKGLGAGRAGGLFIAIAGWEFGAVLAHANARLTVAGRPVGGRDRDDRAGLSLAGEWEVREGFILLGEYLWEKNIGASGSASSELLAGGKAALSRNLTLDVGVRWGTTDASPDVTYLAGITLAFRGGIGQ